MSRRRDIDVAVRTRIGQMLPAMFHDDDMAQRWCAGLDDVLAPVPATLDSFWAYLDPKIAPLDFVEWLAGWVGLDLDQTWDEARRRELVASAHRLYDARGTVRGLSELIELYTGVRPDIEDSGGVSWSAVPDEPLPGNADNAIVVRLAVADPDRIDRARLDDLVETSKPAHVVHRLVIDAVPDRGATAPITVGAEDPDRADANSADGTASIEQTDTEQTDTEQTDGDDGDPGEGAT